MLSAQGQQLLYHVFRTPAYVSLKSVCSIDELDYISKAQVFLFPFEDVHKVPYEF